MPEETSNQVRNLITCTLFFFSLTFINFQDQAQPSQAPAQSQQQASSEPSTTSAQTTPASTTPSTTTTPTPSKTTTAPAPPEPPQVIRQKYEEAKLELQALLSRKKQVDANLVITLHLVDKDSTSAKGTFSFLRSIWKMPFTCLKAHTWKTHSKTEILYGALMAI